MKNILPHISLETNSDGQVKITATDAELFDYIEDHLIEECNVEPEEYVIAEQNSNVFIMYFSKEYNLKEIEDHLLKLDPAEVKRIYSLNN